MDSYYGCKKEKLSSELFEYFVRVENNPEDKEILMKHIQSFKREIDDLSVEKRFPFYKGYMQDIEELQSVYEELYGYTSIYKDEDLDLDLDRNLCCKYIIDYYLTLLEDSIHIYHIMERYIECLEKKHILEFMRMEE